MDQSREDEIGEGRREEVVAPLLRRQVVGAHSWRLSTLSSVARNLQILIFMKQNIACLISVHPPMSILRPDLERSNDRTQHRLRDFRDSLTLHTVEGQVLRTLIES